MTEQNVEDFYAKGSSVLCFFICSKSEQGQKVDSIVSGQQKKDEKNNVMVSRRKGMD